VKSAYNASLEDYSWRVYMAETLRLTCENTAISVSVFGGGGTYMPMKWRDVIDDEPEETLTPDEIKKNMLQKLHALGGD